MKIDDSHIAGLSGLNLDDLETLLASIPLASGKPKSTRGMKRYEEAALRKTGQITENRSNHRLQAATSSLYLSSTR